jgi:predicted nucleotidyltransferase
MHKKFMETALPTLQQDARILGVAVGGSWLKQMDEFSDIDLVIAVEPQAFEAVMRERMTIAESLGTFLGGFTAEHVGEPRMIICLYDVPPLLHVDLKFVSLPDIATRNDDLEILWERDGALSKVLATKPAQVLTVNFQWIEDRFWIWIHNGARKLGRGELFEVIDLITYLRSRVIGPLLAVKYGQQPMGTRRLEMYVTSELAALVPTHPDYNRSNCARALLITIGLYRKLRDEIAPPSLIHRSEAEAAVVKYTGDLFDSFRREV